MNYELKDKITTLNKHSNILRQDYKVKKIGIFGSVAKDKQNKKSDLDIVVEFHEPISMFSFLDLEEYLERILKRKIDLVAKGALKPIVKKQILKEVIYAQ